MSGFEDLFREEHSIPLGSALSFMRELTRSSEPPPDPVLTKEAQVGHLKLRLIKQSANGPVEAQRQAEAAAATDPQVQAALDHQQAVAERDAYAEQAAAMQEALTQTEQRAQAAEQSAAEGQQAMQEQQMATDQATQTAQMESAAKQEAMQQAIQAKDQSLQEQMAAAQHREQVTMMAEDLKGRVDDLRAGIEETQAAAATNPIQAQMEQDMMQQEEEAAMAEQEQAAAAGPAPKKKTQKQVAEADRAQQEADEQAAEADQAMGEEQAGPPPGPPQPSQGGAPPPGPVGPPGAPPPKMASMNAFLDEFNEIIKEASMKSKALKFIKKIDDPRLDTIAGILGGVGVGVAGTKALSNRKEKKAAVAEFKTPKEQSGANSIRKALKKLEAKRSQHGERSGEYLDEQKAVLQEKTASLVRRLAEIW